MAQHLLVCAGGGHLKQLFTLASRIGIAPEDQQWVTFDTGLSRGLLAGRKVVYARYTEPRDLRGAYANFEVAKKMLAETEYQSAISTGANLALSYLPIAARRGVSAHYIESAARADGPSVSGKLIALDKKVNTYTQYPAWSTDRWQYRGSIFDAYAPSTTSTNVRVKKVVVTVGTTESYDFRRLFDKLVPLLDGLDVLWQVGTTDVSDLPITAVEKLPHDELKNAIRDADLVITHSGTGSALTAMDFGKFPILVPRLKEFGEHIDDHQVQIAQELQRRDLAVMCQVGDLDWNVMNAAAARSVETVTTAPPILLDGLSLAHAGS